MHVDLSGIDTSRVVAQLELLDRLTGDALAGRRTKIDVHERHLLEGMDSILRRVSGDVDEEPDDEPTLREKGDDIAAAATAFVTHAATADARRLALCREVFDTFFAEFETFREQHLGAYLAYLMGAIIDPDVTGPFASFVELFEDVEDDACFLKVLRRLFSPEHPVWKHVVVEGGDPASPA